MRQKQKEGTPSGQQSQGQKPAEPLAEGLTVISRNSNPHKNKRSTPAAIARRKNADKDDVPRQRKPYRRLPLEERPGRFKQFFSQEEKAGILQRRDALIPEGRTDREIARIISGEFDRTFRGLGEFMRILVRKGEASENPNHPVHFTEEEVEFIFARRKELMARGKSDARICRILCPELQKMGHSFLGADSRDIARAVPSGKNPSTIKRSEKSVEGQIQNLVKAGRLERNPNRKGGVLEEEEVEEMVFLRESLIAQGTIDSDLIRMLSERLVTGTGTIRHTLVRLIKKGEIPKNPNRFGVILNPEDVAKLDIKRRQLIVEGLKDSEIGERLSKEFGKNGHALSEAIRKLVRGGVLQPNPCKMRRRDNGRSKNFYTYMDDDALLVYARDYYKKRGCRIPIGLSRVDAGLYECLRKRRLLHALVRVDPSERMLSVDSVIDAIRSFGDDK